MWKIYTAKTFWHCNCFAVIFGFTDDWKLYVFSRVAQNNIGKNICSKVVEITLIAKKSHCLTRGWWEKISAIKILLLLQNVKSRFTVAKSLILRWRIYFSSLFYSLTVGCAIEWMLVLGIKSGYSQTTSSPCSFFSIIIWINIYCHLFFLICFWIFIIDI